MQTRQMISGKPLQIHGDPTMLAVLTCSLFMRARFALVKMGGGVVQMSGSIAGNTFARNRSGNYVRARTTPVNPNTVQQGKVRTSLSYLTEAWASSLSPTERISWATYAAAVQMKNRLGEVINLTGFNQFVRSNAEFYRHNATVTKPAPTTLALPEKDIAFAVTGSVATQLLSVAFTTGSDWAIEVGSAMMVYMGQPRQKTRNFFNGPWQYAGQILGGSAPAPTNPTTIAAPMTLVLGQLVTCYARIRRLDGRLTEPFTSTFTVAA